MLRLECVGIGFLPAFKFSVLVLVLTLPLALALLSTECLVSNLLQ